MAWRRRGIVTGLALALGLATYLLARDRAEAFVRCRIEAAAARLGLEVDLAHVRVGVWPWLRLDGLTLRKPGRGSTRLDRVVVTPAGWLGDGGFALHAAVAAGNLDLPGGLQVELFPTEWNLTSTGAILRAPVEGLALERASVPEGGRFSLQATQLDLGALIRVVTEGTAPPLLGRIDAEGKLADGEDARSVHGRFAGLGVDVRAKATVRGRGQDAQFEAHLDLESVTFAEALASLGVERPFGAAELGSLAGTVDVAGTLAAPEACTVSQKLRFHPPRSLPPALLALRGDFTHEIVGPGGARRAILVSPASPDFLPRSEVPAQFLQVLLLGEDAAFFSHPGLDLTELPRALATNWTRGAAARGGSTITQQLAKNLFLSREKSLDRKLKELVLAFLLEAALGKERILEIYLNVIEWGPDLHGLRPAARRYFGKEPRDLTAKEAAFLVALIPGPVKYQRSFADGALSSGFEPLVRNLLYKLHSAGGLSDEALAQALVEPLAFRREPDLPEDWPVE